MIALAFALAASAAAAPAPAAAKPAQKISFVTKDGWTIAANYRPARAGGAVLILAHGVASSKSEWDAFAERLAAEGVGTLALDLRGHGDSKKGPKGPRTYQDFDATGEWPRAAEDVAAAAYWLKFRKVPESRIAFGGASIGANLAARVAAAWPKSPFLLLLSPGPNYRGVPLVRPQTKTLAGASPGDAYAHQTLGPLSGLKNVDIFEAPAGHGVQMFSDPETFGKIADWVVAAARPAR